RDFHVMGVQTCALPIFADFPAVARRLALDVAELGGSVRVRHPVRGIRETSRGVEVVAGTRRFAFDRLVVCAGLGTDAVAAMAGRPGEARVCSFSREYYDET